MIMSDCQAKDDSCEYTETYHDRKIRLAQEGNGHALIAIGVRAGFTLACK